MLTTFRKQVRRYWAIPPLGVAASKSRPINLSPPMGQFISGNSGKGCGRDPDHPFAIQVLMPGCKMALGIYPARQEGGAASPLSRQMKMGLPEE